MNWIEILNKIYKKLEEKELTDIKSEIFEAQLSGGTGGEIFLLVTSTLIKIKNEKPHVYSLIKDEADSIINYGKEIGYINE
jgi:hypothetical protein